MSDKSNSYGKSFLNWEFPDRVYYERGWKWHLFLVIITGAMLFYSILTANFMFVLVIVLFIVIIVFINRRPEMKVAVSITERGIVVGSKFYPFGDIKKFYIIYEPPAVKKLYLEFKSFRPYLAISIEDTSPIILRELLLEYLPEDKTKDSEPPSETIERLLKI
jgi:hypothetical protein